MASSSASGNNDRNNEDQQENHNALIANFQEFCGINDDEESRRCLEKCNWQLEVAVQEYLNHKEGRPSIFDQEGEENAANAEQEIRQRRRPDQPRPFDQLAFVGRHHLRNHHHAVQQRPRVGWAQWTWGLVTIPFQFTYSIFYDVFYFIYSIFFRRQMAVTDPVGDVRTFVDSFEEKYGTDHPTFYVGSYKAALNEAKKDLRYLLVYLHSPTHQDSDQFCRQVLSNPDLIQFVNAHVMFWGASIQSPEGYRVSNALRESTYPFLALICLRDNRMAMVVRQEGYSNHEDLMSILTIAMQDNDPYLAAARAEREQHALNSLLRSEQEREFEDSRRADQQKEEERLKRLQTEKESELARQKEAEDGERIKQEIQQRKKDLEDALEAEPDGTDGCVRMLFNVCFINANCPDDFSLVTNFPRQVLNCRPEWYRKLFPESSASTSPGEDTSAIPSLTEANLGSGSIMIFVQDNNA